LPLFAPAQNFRGLVVLTPSRTDEKTPRLMKADM
jgi:hypothetical protein